MRYHVVPSPQVTVTVPSGTLEEALDRYRAILATLPEQERVGDPAHQLAELERNRPSIDEAMRVADEMRRHRQEIAAESSDSKFQKLRSEWLRMVARGAGYLR